MSKFPHEWFLKYTNVSRRARDYTNYVALINIFYDEKMYQKISQIPAISTEALFGNVGGQLGLFMGIR